MKSINQRIKDLREDLDITTKYMAEQLNMTQANYSRIENGIQKLTIDVFLKICEILKVDPKVFFDNGKRIVVLSDDEYNAFKDITFKILNIKVK